MMILSNAWPPKSTFAFLLLTQLFVGNVGSQRMSKSWKTLRATKKELSR